MEERIDTILVYLEQAIRTAGEFGVEQAPLVVAEVLKWGLVKSSIKALTFVVLLIIVSVIFKKFWKYTSTIREDYGDRLIARAVGSIGYSFIGGLLFVGTIAQTMNAIQIAIAPRLYLLEYASNLLTH